MNSNDYVKSVLSDTRDFFLQRIIPININEISCVKNTQVSLPARLNLSAGWNDTPPYSLEKEGSILNMSFLIDNKKPITTRISKLKIKYIILESEASGKEIVKSIDEIIRCDNPNERNAVIKASLIASGLIPNDSSYKLDNLLDATGGFKIKTTTNNIPIGSGLGTSSIIIASIIMAIYKSINKNLSEYDLFMRVAIAEQIMRTGGGFQDQIGAVVPGIKLIHFIPKKDGFPNIEINKINMSKKTNDFLKNHLKVIFTGKTRLAKNLLETVMGNYILEKKDSCKILEEINNVSYEMKMNLEEEKFEEFGKNMIKSYELCKKMYSTFTNEDIEKIIDSIKDKALGYMIAGAGGGGYLIVLYR